MEYVLGLSHSTSPLASFLAIRVGLMLNSLVVQGKRAKCATSPREHLREVCRDLHFPRPRTIQGQPTKASYHGEHLKGTTYVLGSPHRDHLKDAARMKGFFSWRTSKGGHLSTRLISWGTSQGSCMSTVLISWRTSQRSCLISARKVLF